MQKLSEQEITEKLQQLCGWTRDGEVIRRRWEFEDFRAAIAFINQVADIADQHDHHPELFNVYNQVELRYSTHEAGGLTERDFIVAAEIDKIQSG